jgi:xanthine dehydrogenase accessory factor
MWSGSIDARGRRAMNLELLSALNAERDARRAAVLVTDVATGDQRLVREAETDADPLRDLLRERLRLGKSGLVEAEDRQLFLTVQVPPVKVIVVGAVHISQALAPMAQSLDLDVTVIDPRTAFASPERFPNVPVLAEWPDAALPRLGLDRYTALVALTHDPKIDDPALIAALRAECFYIGALGSRKTHARRV